MKIVVTDGYTLNPGDLDWSPLRALGDVEVYDHTPTELVLARLEDAEMALINKVHLDRATIAQLPKLKYIGVNATGYNVLDLQAARDHGIVVTNVPAYGTTSVAQHTIALLLELTNRVGMHDESVRRGDWSRSQDWSYWLTPQVELSGLTLGILGKGSIGSAVAKIAAAFGMRVIARSRSFQDVGEEELLTESDVLSIHVPLTPETDKWLNAQRLALMKPSALLLNTGRGGLVDDNALAEALNTGSVAGAGLDVLTLEPPVKGNPLIGAKNCIITPHIAWATTAARQRLLDTAVNNAKAFIEGNPVNVVS